jgi:hypothetical protein
MSIATRLPGRPTLLSPTHRTPSTSASTHRPGDIPSQYYVVACFRDHTPPCFAVDDFLDMLVVRQYVHFDAKPNDRVWLVSFMQYDLGFFDHETGRITSAENPFGAKVLPMCPE